MKNTSDFILDCFINSTTEAVLASKLSPEEQAKLLTAIEDRFQLKLSDKLRKDLLA